MMDFNKMTIREIFSSLQNKETSSLDLCKFFLDRIKKIDPKIKACVSVFEKEALEEANLADKRIASGEKGPLLGIPYLVDDNILAKGKKTTASSKMLENYIAPYDATVIAKLKDAGAVLLGKTNIDELSHGSSSENSAFFVSRNPWDLDRLPGSGSASALASGLCVFALSGNIRKPASFCGLSGLKPSYLRVSRQGLIPMASSIDTIGPLTKSAEDSSLVLSHISDFKEEGGTNKLKIAIVPEYIDSLEGKHKETILKAINVFKESGAEIKEISFKYSKYVVPAYFTIVFAETSSNLARLDGIRYGASFDYKAKGFSLENLAEIYSNNRGMSFGSEVKKRIMLGTYALSSGYFDAYYKKAMALKDLLIKEFDDIFSDCDIILTPTTLRTASKIGEANDDYEEDIFTSASSLAGLPAMSVPVDFVDGLPFGLQIIANKFKEDLVLKAAKVFQEKTNFHKNSPNL